MYYPLIYSVAFWFFRLYLILEWSEGLRFGICERIIWDPSIFLSFESLEIDVGKTKWVRREEVEPSIRFLIIRAFQNPSRWTNMLFWLATSPFLSFSIIPSYNSKSPSLLFYLAHSLNLVVSLLSFQSHELSSNRNASVRHDWPTRQPDRTHDIHTYTHMCTHTHTFLSRWQNVG